MALTGTIETLGYHRPAAGWLILGTLGVGPVLAKGLSLSSFRAHVEGVAATEKAFIALFERPSVDTGRTGFLLFVAQNGMSSPRPAQISLWFNRQQCQLTDNAKTVVSSGPQLAEQCLQSLGTAFAGQVRELGSILNQQGFAGVSTVETLDELVRAGFDEIVFCGDGVLVVGWLLATPGAVRSVSLCWDDHRLEMPRDRWVEILRPDVLENGGGRLGFDDPRCGYIAYVPAAKIGSSRPYLTIETRTGQVGYTKSPQLLQGGIAAIKRVLGTVEVPQGGIRQAFGEVLGPAIAQLNSSRFLQPPDYRIIKFGVVPETPRCSLIVPLFGRIDYLEYQIGLMCGDPSVLAWDLIYVVDDPDLLQAAQDLSHSLFARFDVPFRLVLLTHNLGYAPANNVGLSLARGKFVGFLNSDVFPKTPGFLDRLADTLEKDSSLGAVGAVLLFEDGSVQHEGMVLNPLPQRDGLVFPIHTHKARRPRLNLGVTVSASITGACMVMRRKFALELGGFDESFVLGDFEDCDLCNKIQAKGKVVAVDHRVQLYHLERQSQTSSGIRWRRNLTLYNAWLYNTKWHLRPSTELLVQHR